MEQAWSDWLPLSPSIAFTPDQLAETLDGGQAFRWRFSAEGSFWQGTWGNHIARIRQSPNHSLTASFLASSSTSIADLELYLGSQTNWEEMENALPWRSDEHLAQCLDRFKGLRLLNQPFPETVLCFLCSATKQIPQIKIMCDRLATSLGSPIGAGIHALPTWDQIAAASEADLRSLGLGFRAKNIKRTADIIATQPGLLQKIEKLPYPEAKSQLTQLPGVGEKIADCALLFGASMFEAFPVDTWIIKVLQKRYDLLDWSPSQLAQFGRIHFGRYAGFAQQFLFSYERYASKSR